MKKGLLVAILIIILFISAIALVGGFVYMQFNREPSIPEHAVLQIQVSGNMTDSEDSVLANSLTLRDIFFQLQRAKNDRRIKGIILKISYIKAGIASLEDFGRMIRDFKTSGKPVIAYLEDGGQREYLLASFADKIYAIPGGDLFINGFASEAVFLKSTLDKLGITAELFHIGEYKTASNIFTKDHMTPAHRESLQTLLDDVLHATVQSIAVNRKLPEKKIYSLLNEMPLDAESYQKAGLIDKIAFQDEMLKEFPENCKTVSFSLYKQTTSPRPFTGKKRIAVIFAQGEIHSGASGKKSVFGETVLGSDTLVRQLRSVRKSKSVKAVILRINSPGGSALASEVIRREIELLCKEKPLIISMGDVAASGGYWISLSGSKILALPQTITASIGVIGGKFVNRGLYDKIGIRKEIVKTTRYSAMFSDYQKFSAAEKKMLNRLLQKSYQAFISLVSKNRRIDIQKVDKMARGRVWLGSRALELNLVDSMGGMITAFHSAREAAGIDSGENVSLVMLPRKKTLFDIIFSYVGISSVSPINISEQLSRYTRFFPAYMMPYKIQFQ